MQPPVGENISLNAFDRDRIYAKVRLSTHEVLHAVFLKVCAIKEVNP